MVRNIICNFLVVLPIAAFANVNQKSPLVKAVQEVGENQSFRLNEEATRFLGIKSLMLEQKNGMWIGPKMAIVAIGTEKFVFRVRDGWYQRVKVKVQSQNSEILSDKNTNKQIGGVAEKKIETVNFTCPEILATDLVAIEGSSFLRSAEMEKFAASSGDGDGD